MLLEINVKPDHQKKSFKDLKHKILAGSRNLIEGLKDKEKFATKMNMSPLQHRHHPTTNVDIPKVEICDGDKSKSKSKSKSSSQQTLNENSVLKYTIVIKLMNLPSKWGIAYQLSNSDIGILMNDGNKILYKQIYDIIYCFDNKDKLEFKNSFK